MTVTQVPVAEGTATPKSLASLILAGRDVRHRKPQAVTAFQRTHPRTGGSYFTEGLAECGLRGSVPGAAWFSGEKA